MANEVEGTRVRFGGVAAPLLYVSATQVDAVVPYEVAGSASVDIEVEFKGTFAIATGVPIAPSAPGIYTANGTGQGQARCLNQDGSANSVENSAARGSTIRLFGTGEGQTTPPGTTGEVIQDGVKRPALPVSVKIGGIEAQVLEAGSTPGQVAGAFQFDVVIPQGVAPGPAVPVVLAVGSARSQDGVTIAVK